MTFPSSNLTLTDTRSESRAKKDKNKQKVSELKKNEINEDNEESTKMEESSKILNTATAGATAATDGAKIKPENFKNQSVLNGGILVREKYRHYGYHFEDYDNRQYEIFRFRYLDENDLTKKLDTSGFYSKFNQTAYMDNSVNLLFKMLKCDIKLIKSIFLLNGFTATDSHDWNCLWINSSGKGYIYENLNQFQKVNHFPHSYELTRKDKLAYNISKMQSRYGEYDFQIMTESYVLPDQFDNFYENYTTLKREWPEKNTWIIKPACGSQGKGIYVTSDIDDIAEDSSNVVCRYITNPLLINGFKFDLRIYVWITSYEPLRIYCYKEGLVRFASEEYEHFDENKLQEWYDDDEETNYYSNQKENKSWKKKRFAHLTNYSINKKNNKFIQNASLEQDDVGGKWSMSALCRHMKTIGIDLDLLWSKIYDIIIKVIITGEYPITKKMKNSNINQKNWFELYGFDILLDSDLKPWLLEINLSPSLGTDSPLDYHIKSSLLIDTFNLVGVRKFDRKKESLNKMASRVKSISDSKKTKNLLQRYTKMITKSSVPSAKSKSNNSFNNKVGDNDLVTEPYSEGFFYSNGYTNNDVLINNRHNNLSKSCKDIVNRMAGVKYKQEILDTLEERWRVGNYVPIYPSKGSKMYDYFFINQKPVNEAIYNFLYNDTHGFLKDVTTEVIEDVAAKLNYKEVEARNYFVEEPSIQKAAVVVSRSDLGIHNIYDLMIEYISQISDTLKECKGRSLKSSWKERIDKYVIQNY